LRGVWIVVSSSPFRSRVLAEQPSGYKSIFSKWGRKAVTFSILFYTATHLGSIPGWLARIATLWIAISLSSTALIVLATEVRSLLLRIKVQMAEFDRTMLPPLFDRRREKHAKFRLRLTRRQITRTEGEMLEKLNHAIDYLIDTYDLREFSGTPKELSPAEFVAAQMLLQCRAEMLKDYPPLPSFSYLVKRRLAYLMNSRRPRV
jgi:hypothetical protein